MRIPDSLATLVDYGIIQKVVRPLMSGKEAQIYLVISEGEERVAKVYKEAQARTFKHRAEYTEGRKTRNSRDQRAINKRSRHGRAQDEAAWRSTEVDVIYRLREAGVRVPAPHQFVDGVLVMELIKDAEGNPAPRLGDRTFEPGQALEIYHELVGQVVRMLCAGVVHGDLSEFNVLIGAEGPAIIDFPQAVDPASNQNARRLLLRDVANLHGFAARFAPHVCRPLYAEEMWELYQGNRLSPSMKLSGGYRPSEKKADTAEVLGLIDDAQQEERARREARGELRGEELPKESPTPFRTVVNITPEAPKPRSKRSARNAKPSVPARDQASAGNAGASARKKGSRRRRPAAAKDAREAPRTATSAGQPKDAEKRRPRRRRRPKQAVAAGAEGSSAPRSDASATPSAAGRQRTSPKVDEGTTGKQRDAAASPTARPAKKRARRRRRPSAKRPSHSEA